MNNRRFLMLNASILFFVIAVLIPAVSPKVVSIFAQNGNSIIGQVSGQDGEPLYDVYVELLNDYGQAINRTRTDGTGTYRFFGMPSGRYSIRVTPFGTDYEEQVKSTEIVNFTREDINGNQRIGGYDNQQLDFYLKFRKDYNPQTTGSIFAQEVPEAAKKLYEKAVSDLSNKKEKEGLAGLIAAIEAFPKYFAALERLANEYSRLKQFEAARILFNNALEVNPRSYKSWYGLAFSSFSLNKFEEARMAVEKSIEIYKNAPQPYFLLGMLKRQSKNFEDAEKNLLKAKELAKDSMPMIHLQLGLLYGMDLKRYGEAAKELKLFLKAQPNAKDKEKIEALIKEYDEKAKTDNK